MSGGVDSSVAAFLMKESGFDCAGATMKLFPEELCGGSPQDGAEDARRVAERLELPFFIFDFSDNFSRDVIERFVADYKKGLTPNPCICCNRSLKFGKFLSRAKELDMERIVTGHYAVVCYDAASKRWGLKKGKDESKDQSYVLYSLTQQQLACTLLPLGVMTKGEVREIAAANGFINAGKRESQDICFIPDGDYAAFIERRSGEAARPGRFVDAEGRTLGEHRGLVRYTIGQRRGLGLSLRESLYVRAKRAADNTVVLGKDNELFSKSLTASDINLIACDKISSPLRVSAKIRYRHREQPATVEQLSENRIRVEFDEPQRAVTPGQAVVLYDGESVIGGGTIE